MNGKTAADHRVGAKVLLLVAFMVLPPADAAAEQFEGEFFSGEGDAAYLRMLDISRRMFGADAEFQNVAMLYHPGWNGFVEGPTWGAWWIQNSYGPTYCALPFYTEPYVTFLQNAQDLWFDQMGDGKKVWKWRRFKWVVPDGHLCDAAGPGWVIPKQGDGRVDIHDWGIEFTAAGLLMQAELLLIGRDRDAIGRYLPRLERCANFIETRRDPKNNLFLAGAAGNLLAPSYAGYKKPDGTYGKAYLTGLSITYIAALDRLVELEKLAGRADKATLYAKHRESARKGLGLLTTDEGYFIKSLDPDGTRHGVFGAKKYGYFETVCNHDAICFRVAGDDQAEKIYAKLASIRGLRPHGLIITNYPSLDDMYVKPAGWLWKHGTWVNGGHWTTCEARMIMAYYRVGRYADAGRAMGQILKFARAWRMDNPLVNFGAAVYQPNQPINLCYDTLGAPAAMVRGLFEYIYRADALTLVPHVPAGITRLEQHFPIRFGRKRLYLATVGSGPVTGVTVNSKPWRSFDAKSVLLPYDKTPDDAIIQIALGGAKPGAFRPRKVGFDKGEPIKSPGPIDQKLWGPAQAGNMTPNELPLRIGADSQGTSCFPGQIAQPMVFGRALNGEEIASLAAGKGEKLAKDTDLVGAWSFGGAKVGEFPAAAGVSAGKAVGKVEIVDTPHGKALRLAGEGYVNVPHCDALNLPRACTMSAWIRPGRLPAIGARIIDKTTVGTSDGYLLDTYPGRSLRLICQRGVVTFKARLLSGKWTHVAGTVDASGAMVLYVNGKRVATGTPKASTMLGLEAVRRKVVALAAFHGRCVSAGLAGSYEAAHARLGARTLAALVRRLELLAAGKLKPLPGRSHLAALKCYVDTAGKLHDGLAKTINSYKTSTDPHKKRVHELWTAK